MRLKPLCNTKSERQHCYLLTLDEGYNVLLDCGWTDSFDPADLAELAQVAPTVRAVLLSHGDLAHLGAVPYACAKLGLAAAVFATVPVHRMGQMALYDAHEAAVQRAPFDCFSLDDVDAAFDRFTQVRYLQRFTLPGSTVEITAYPAGHSLGGAVWRIQSEADDLVYAVDFNHNKDRHLNGTVLETLHRPSLMIADARNAAVTMGSRKQRDRELFDAILSTLRSGGNVLMPTDTAGRALELALCLDQQWRAMRLGGQYGIALLTNCAFSTVEFAKSQLEWMGDAISQAFDTTRENPFDFKHLKLVHTIEELKALTKPLCILASGGSLAPGFARDILAEWAQFSACLVLFTDRSFEGSLARRIIESLPTPPPAISLELGHSTVIEEPQETAEKQAPVKMQVDIKPETTPTTMNVSVNPPAYPLLPQQLQQQQQQPIDIYSTMATSKPEAQSTVSKPPTSKDRVNPLESACSATAEQFLAAGFAYPIFPYRPRERQFDAYGEVIDPSQFVSPEERERLMAEARRMEEAEAERRRTEERVAAAVAAAAAAAAAAQQAAATAANSHIVVKPKKRKYTSEQRTVPLHCQIRFVDMEGRSDGKSLRTIISHVAPRRLVLVHGKPDAQDELAKWCCENMKLLKSVECPALGVTVDATSEMRVYRAVLHDSLVDSAAFQRSAEYDVAYVHAQVADVAAAGLPVLVPAPASESQLKWHHSVFIGDLKLYELSSLLAKQGFSVQFDRGALVCNGGRVVVRKAEATEDDGGIASTLTIEGALSDDYYRVRELLYSQLVIV